MEVGQGRVIYLEAPRNVIFMRVICPARGVLLTRLPVTPEMMDEDDRMIDVLHAMGYLARDEIVVVDYRDVNGEIWLLPTESKEPELILRATS